MRGIHLFAGIAIVLWFMLALPGPGHYGAPGSARAVTYVAGDVNCDMSADAGDVVAGLGALTGMTDAGCFIGGGDVDCDGSTGLQDMILLQRYVAGLPTNLGPACPAIGSSYGSDESATSLIEQAYRAGTITNGQRLLYHIQAELAVDALPPQFRASGADGVESAIFAEAAAAWNTLSKAEQDALRPYIVAPSAPDSWVEQQDAGLRAASIQWETVSNSKVKVWWQSRRPEDAAKAAGILAELESTIWPKLINYMGEAHAPLSDAGYPNSGGDGRFDIYLLHIAPDKPGEKPVLGYVTPQLDAEGGYDCDITPTYMALNSREPLTPQFYSTVAHEFMHAIQFTYEMGNCDDYAWMMESTATWAESFVYPSVNVEHGWAYKYLDDLQTSLEHWEYKAAHQYGSYLFWYYLEKKEGLTFAVRDAWQAAFDPDSLNAIESVIEAKGGFEELWPKSALYNWNREPFEDFDQLDKLLLGAKWKDTDVDTPNGPVGYQIPTSLGHMQQDHYHFGMMESVKSLTFINPFYGAQEEYAKVQAIVNINGTWERVARDWTDKERVSFCFDKPEEHVDELVIIITNSDFTDRTHKFAVGDAELVASPAGCKGWVGSANAEIHYFDATFSITVDNLLFEPAKDPGPPQNRYLFYDLAAMGDATWHVSGVWPGGCIPSGTMTLPAPGTPHGALGDITIDLETGNYYIAASGAQPNAMFTITCGGSSFELPWPSIFFIWNGGLTDTPLQLENGKFVLDWEYTDPSEFYGGTWRWHLTELE